VHNTATLMHNDSHNRIEVSTFQLFNNKNVALLFKNFRFIILPRRNVKLPKMCFMFWAKTL